MRKRHVSAIAVQKVYRGFCTRGPFGQLKLARRDMLRREELHTQRVRGIKKKERELSLLARVPVEEFVNYDRLRKDHSATVRGQRVHASDGAISLPEQRGDI